MAFNEWCISSDDAEVLVKSVIKKQSSRTAAVMWCVCVILVMEGQHLFFHLPQRQRRWIIQSGFSPYISLEMPHYAAALLWNPMPRDCELSTWMPEPHSRRSVTSLSLFLCASWPPSLFSSSYFFVSHHPCLDSIPASPSSPCCEEEEKQGGKWRVGSVITFAMIVFKYQLTHTHRGISLCFCRLRNLDLYKVGYMQYHCTTRCHRFAMHAHHNKPPPCTSSVAFGVASTELPLLLAS